MAYLTDRLCISISASSCRRRDVYETTKGFLAGSKQEAQYSCVKLLKNIYGLKQTRRVWNQHLHKGLTELNYQQSKVDLCLYYRKGNILAVYIDDSVLASNSKSGMENTVKELAKNSKSQTNET